MWEFCWGAGKLRPGNESLTGSTVIPNGTPSGEVSDSKETINKSV